MTHTDEGVNSNSSKSTYYRLCGFVVQHVLCMSTRGATPTDIVQLHPSCGGVSLNGLTNKAPAASTQGYGTEQQLEEANSMTATEWI